MTVLNTRVKIFIALTLWAQYPQSSGTKAFASSQFDVFVEEQNDLLHVVACKYVIL
jgi:hypothetical protein